jgi:hypothetical protein
MLTTAHRPYTDAELDEYTDRMVAGRAYSITVIVTLGIIFGGITTLFAFVVHWLYAWFTSGAATWTFSLTVGAAVAAGTSVTLWLASRGEDWTEQPPEGATDVSATAYAAWRTESDGLDVVFVLRVEADRYLLITENALTTPLVKDKVKESPAETIPSDIRLVLMGEGEFRIAMNVSLTGLAIPLTYVTAMPAETDPDYVDETPIPDGLYITDDLPTRIRRAIGAA